MPGKFAVSVICVGKLRETFWKDAEAEYTKRLSAFTTRLNMIEVADEPTPEGASPATEEAIRAKEGERILARLGERDYVIALDRGGVTLDSPKFSARLEKLAADGASTFSFVIGGSLGIHDSVLTRADLTLSFGAFTYPHQLMRVILLEQLYRAAKIARGDAYHK